MKKFLYLLLVLGVLWLVKLSYDSFLVSSQLTQLQDALHSAEQKNANLNDQLVALQRQPNVAPSQSNQAQSNPNLSADAKNPLKQSPQSVLSPTLILKQKLELVQFALQQQAFVYALEQLQQLDQSIEHYALAESLKQTLHHANAEDQKVVQQFVLARNTQQDQLDDVLRKLDFNLQQQQNNQILSVAHDQKDHFWEKWFKVESVDQNLPELVNRKFILKEAQIRLLLAQQALAKGQYLEYQSILNLVLVELNRLPDQSSQKLKVAVEKLKQTQMIPVPQLSSAAILE